MKKSILFSILGLLTLWVNAQVTFIENKGQWADYVQYRQQLHQGEFIMAKDRFVYCLREPYTHAHAGGTHDAEEKEIYKGHNYQARFEGANDKVNLAPEHRSEAIFNYYQGNDKKHWAKEVRAYQAVKYENLYEGIDMRVYEAENHLKYDFYVQPQVSPTKIRVVYEGADALYLDEKGNLHIQTSLPEVVELAPIAYQMVKGEKKIIPCTYSLEKNTLSFAFPQGYNADLPLVIDPSIVFSTLTGSSQDNWGFTATGDRDGNAIGGGIIYSTIQGSSGYPLMGAYQSTFQGGTLDAAITKYNPTGSSLIFSTYLGGSGDDQPHSILTAPNGEVYVLGRTNSADFPMEGQGYDTTHNGNYDIYLARFSPTGTLLASTFLGGSDEDGVNYSANFSSLADLKYNYGDDARGSLMVDKIGDCYVAMCTKSTDFPVTANAFQPTSGGMQDGVVFKFNKTLQNLIFASYIGGSANDAVYDLTIDENKDIFVTGGTKSPNFPTTTGILQPSFAGFVDGFVAKIDYTGSPLLASTYLGTTAYDQSYFIKTDTQNLVYVYGQTLGNMPIQNSTFGQNDANQFIACLSNDLTAYQFRTTFGVTGAQYPNISPSAFWVDGCRHLYVSGWSGNTGFGNSSGSFNMQTTPDAFSSTTDGNDFYFAVIDKDVQTPLYATFFGGDGLFEHVDGGTSGFDRFGVLYQAVCAACGASTNFPTTPGVWSEVNNSTNCNLGVVKMDMYNCTPSTALSPAAAAFSFRIYPNPSEGYFTLTALPNHATLEVFDALGRCVFFQKEANNTTQLDLTQAEKGLYWLKVSSEGKYATQKMWVR